MKTNCWEWRKFQNGHFARRSIDIEDQGQGQDQIKRQRIWSSPWPWSEIWTYCTPWQNGRISLFLHSHWELSHFMCCAALHPDLIYLYCEMDTNWYSWPMKPISQNQACIEESFQCPRTLVAMPPLSLWSGFAAYRGHSLAHSLTQALTHSLTYPWLMNWRDVGEPESQPATANQEGSCIAFCMQACLSVLGVRSA